MKTGVGVVGLGYWGPHLARNFLKIPGISVEGCDIADINLKAFSKEFPGISTTRNYLKFLSDNSIDILAIATPVSSHFQIAKDALLAGKHVLIEKPMTQTSKEAKELIALAKKKNRILMVGHTFVYSEAVRKIKNIVSQKQLGKIFYYDSTRINLGIIQKDVNVIWDLAVHDLSILNFIFPQKIRSVQAFGSKFISKSHEEVAHVFIRYEDTMTAHIHVSWLSPVKIRKTFIGGSKKMIAYDDIEPSEKIKIYDKNVTIRPSEITPFSPAYRSGDILIPHLKQEEALFTQLKHFIECVTSGKTPITNGNEGLKVVKLLESIDQALATRKEVFLHE